MSNQATIFGFPKYPPFQLGKPRFSQETFLGRWLHMMDLIDPRMLFATKEQQQECVGVLNMVRAGTLPPLMATDEQLWTAQKVVQSTFHPDTGEKIFMPFRMAGYVPFGSVIVTGLLLPNPTLAQTVFWQWLNQSHNACVNYANRNATKPTDITKFIQGYAGAVTVAVGISVGLSLLIRRANRFPAATKRLIQKFVPLPSVCLASTFNVVLMRFHELKTGVDVYDSVGTVIGTSKLAAKKALKETALTRAFLPAPIMLIPPIVMTWLEKKKFMLKRPYLHLPFNAVVCTLSFAFALPIAIALFPQESRIAVKDMEPEFATKTGETELRFNKGL